MRAACLALVAALSAAPAAAQPLQQMMDLQTRAAELRALQDLATRQAVTQHNDLVVLDAQLRTLRVQSDIQVQAQRPRLRPPPTGAPPPKIDTGQLASIPDSKLEASNAAVRAVAGSRR